MFCRLIYLKFHSQRSSTRNKWLHRTVFSTHMSKDVLILLDFQGTLSIGAATFGQTRSLEAALHNSGLAQHGISDSRIYWDVIGTPTWEECSTSLKLFSSASVQRVVAYTRDVLRRENSDLVSVNNDIENSVQRFIHHYMQASVIPPAWESVLKTSTRENVQVVVATDHFVEFVHHIISELQRFDLPPSQIIKSSLNGATFVSSLDHETTSLTCGSERQQLLIAHSSFLCGVKASENFWTGLHGALAERFRHPKVILLIDDFGRNEVSECDYSDESKVNHRQSATMSHLRAVFPDADVRCLPFHLNLPDLHSNKCTTTDETVNACDADDELLSRAIRNATDWVLQNLSTV